MWKLKMDYTVCLSGLENINPLVFHTQKNTNLTNPYKLCETGFYSRRIFLHRLNSLIIELKPQLQPDSVINYSPAALKCSNYSIWSTP